MTQNPLEDFKRNIAFHVRHMGGEILLSAHMTDRYHDVTLEVVVDAATARIVAVSADFVRSPSSHCPHAVIRLERLRGLVIGRGLNRLLQEIFGGSGGCGNLRVMLQGVLPLALNIQAAAGFTDEQQMLDSIREKLTGTCAGYPLSSPADSQP